MIKNSSVLPLSKPSPGSAGKTGTWRLKRPVIDHSKCIRCRLCWLYCPDNVIEIHENSDDFIAIDYQYCKGCGICANECPTKAITMIEEV